MMLNMMIYLFLTQWLIGNDDVGALGAVGAC